MPRARQNVVWEFGFFVGAIGLLLANELKASGIPVDASKLL